MKCPKCGAEMREKNGRYGRFLGCSNWPRCNGTRDLNPTDNSTPTKHTKPTKRTAGLRVIFPETINYGFRRRQLRPDKLSIYRHDDAEATADLNECCEFFEVHPADARAKLEKSGHADSNWSCVKNSF